MKYTRNRLLVLCTFFSTIALCAWTPNPKDTFFAFDIDEVLAERTYFFKAHLVLGGMWYYPSNSHNWLTALYTTRNAYKKDTNGEEQLYDDDGNNVNGLTFHFLHHGIKDANMIPYASWVVKTIEKCRQPINGMIELCNYLKSKGYAIVFATNKDRVSYDAFAKTSGKSLTNIPEKVFVAHPGNNDAVLQKIQLFAQQKNICPQYKKLANKALTIQSSETVENVPAMKPDSSYYEHVYLYAQTNLHKKNMLFIDDKLINIKGFEKFQKNARVNAYGIVFKNPYQLIKVLIELGVLSPEHDQEFLQKMKQYK